MRVVHDGARVARWVIVVGIVWMAKMVKNTDGLTTCTVYKFE